MAEVSPSLLGTPKPDAYRTLQSQIESVLEGVNDPIAGMATTCALVHHAFSHLWTGYYRVVEPGRLLRVGPYQGTLGCLDIEFGRGVCGTAAVRRASIVVPDVRTFPGHITCDARSRSEIVIPVFGPNDELIAVLDIDSATADAFDDTDREGLERIVQWFARTGS